MDGTIPGSMNDNINMDSTIPGSMNDNINMEFNRFEHSSRQIAQIIPTKWYLFYTAWGTSISTILLEALSDT